MLACIVFMLRSGSFPAHPCSPCVYVGVWVLFLRPCATPLHPFSRSSMFTPVFMLVFGTSCTEALCCLVSPCSPICVHAAFRLLPRSPMLALRLCWCLGPVPVPLRRALAPLLSLTHVQPCVHAGVRDLLHRGLVRPRFAMLAHSRSCCVRDLPFLVRLAFGTSCTEALCYLVSPMLTHRIHAVFGSFLFLFALRSGPPAQGPCAALFRSCTLMCPCHVQALSRFFHVCPWCQVLLFLRPCAAPLHSFPDSPMFAFIGTSCTEALCCLVSLMLAHVFMLRSGSFPTLLMFALQSGPPLPVPLRCAAALLSPLADVRRCAHARPCVHAVFKLLHRFAHVRPVFMLVLVLLSSLTDVHLCVHAGLPIQSLCLAPLYFIYVRTCVHAVSRLFPCSLMLIARPAFMLDPPPLTYPFSPAFMLFPASPYSLLRSCGHSSPPPTLMCVPLHSSPAHCYAKCSESDNGPLFRLSSAILYSFCRAAARDRRHGSTAPVEWVPCPFRQPFSPQIDGTATARFSSSMAR
ncbi:hypothetical protein C8J57DRAFT_1503059 [Mycena rebaudengoi]|nr:hypothetical protein C8J57DRAFT_1503059 [Mycena rebaudengoi]